MGRIVTNDGTDEANFYIRFKGIERYHEYDSLDQMAKEWKDKDTWMKEEVLVLEKPKSEARRIVDLFLKRTKHIPTTKHGYLAWKQNAGIYKTKGGSHGE